MNTIAWQRIGPNRHDPTRVLVLGSTGMVGRAWVNLLAQRQIEHTAVHRPLFDLANQASIDRCLEGKYDLVVNAAAWTDVDGAEKDQGGCNQANAHAVEQIALRCEAMEAVLITYSTDYVFSGQAAAPYPIDARVDPINAYGQSKALGEAKLRASTDRHLLIRTSWVYAPWGKNFVLTMMGMMQARDHLKVVSDQCGRPTSATHLANGSLGLYLAGCTGTWHLTDDGECSWFGLATEIRGILDAKCVVEPCASDEFPRPAKRPALSTLDIESTRDTLGDIGPWQERVRSVIERANARQQ